MKYITFFIPLIMYASCTSKLSEPSLTPEPITDIPAFVGAEGAGAFTTGGRGGKVLFVTRLDDDENECSFRLAVHQSSPRMILFNVSIRIDLKTHLSLVILILTLS